MRAASAAVPSNRYHEPTGGNITAKTGKKIGGISANSLVLPIVVVLSILHIAIIGLIMAINTSSSSLLSETATNFVLLPIAENGEINVGPLNAYVQELGNDRRGSQILAKFQEYDVDPRLWN